MSIDWPARYDQPAGLSKRNDIVRSATNSRLTSGVWNHPSVALID
jgi:hypothetical protein